MTFPDPTLDPGDWEAFRALSHRAVDDMIDWIRSRREDPAWRELPDRTGEVGVRSLPRKGTPAEVLYREFQESVLPYTLGNTHPRFFGWVHGAGTPVGALAEYLAASVNANLGGREHAPVHLEREVLGWCRELFEFPADAGGILLSGTSMATVVGLAVARFRATRRRDRIDGLHGGPRLTGYTSLEAHNSVEKAFELLGLGRAALRVVPVDASGALDPRALEAQVREDREAGHHPFALVATLGSVNTGAFDDLVALRAVADRQGLWLHVDGAFGAVAKCSPVFAPLTAGVERADSLAFDFHKWFQVPYDAGCVLVRDGALHRAAFESRRDYLVSQDEGAASGEPWFCDFGPELSRGFRALKVWFTLRHYGIERMGAVVEAACANVRHLAARVEDAPELELLAPVSLNVACLRYRWPDADPEELDRVNQEILVELHRRGIAVPSPTRVGDAFALRVCVCNHRTLPSDLDALADAIVGIGAERTRVPAG